MESWAADYVVFEKHDTGYGSLPLVVAIECSQLFLEPMTGPSGKPGQRITIAGVGTASRQILAGRAFDNIVFSTPAGEQQKQDVDAVQFLDEDARAIIVYLR
ncbi:MAG: hypothetical protein PW843_25125 [Azospirillaceae bacterium]|nr:hypothetical protein [Azospirillaceae bacterium]